MNNSISKMFYEDIITDKEKYAKVFSEGDIYLEKLLLEVWNQGIHTIGCCRGHNEKKSYIAFDLNVNIDKVIDILKKIKKENLGISFIHSDNKYSMSIKSCNISNSIKNIVNNMNKEIDDLSDDLEKTINYLNNRAKKEYLNIQFKYLNNSKIIYINTWDKELINELKDKYDYMILNEKLELYQFKIEKLI